jgi:hypothetical protein
MCPSRCVRLMKSGMSGTGAAECVSSSRWPASRTWAPGTARIHDRTSSGRNIYLVFPDHPGQGAMYWALAFGRDPRTHVRDRCHNQSDVCLKRLEPRDHLTLCRAYFTPSLWRLASQHDATVHAPLNCVATCLALERPSRNVPMLRRHSCNLPIPSIIGPTESHPKQRNIAQESRADGQVVLLRPNRR